MFMREKVSGKYRYLQVVHNRRVEGKVKQDVIATLGRVDVLQRTGQIDALLASGSRFASKVAVLDAHRRGKTPAAQTKRIGASVVFERLWKESGVPKAIKGLLRERKYGFDVERGVFVTVLHRLFDPGSDRAAEIWRRRYKIEGAERLGLHHLYPAFGGTWGAALRRERGEGESVDPAVHEGFDRGAAFRVSTRPVQSRLWRDVF